MGLKFKLGIGIPLNDDKIHKQFFASFIGMYKPDNTTVFFPQFQTDFPRDIAICRNDIVEKAMLSGCTHLVMMDTDQIYPEDAIRRVLAHGKDVVATTVHRRYPPFDPILLRGKLGEYSHVPDEECYSGDLVEVDSVGCGFICYDMSVFISIKKPWFELTNLPDGRIVGEDIYFCHKLRRSGFQIYVDTSLQIDHLTTYAVNRTTYELFKKLKGFDWNVEKAA